MTIRAMQLTFSRDQRHPMMFRRIALAGATIATLGAASAPLASGVSFVIKSSTTRDGSTSASNPGTRVQALGGMLRFDGDDSGTSTGGKGSYVIVDPAAKSLSMVMPESKQFLQINLADSTAQALGSMASLMAATTIVTDIQVTGTALGGGGVVNGYPTNRYRITTSYAEMPSAGEGQRKVRLVEEFWVTSQLRDIPDPMEAFTRAFGGKNGMPQLGGTLSELMRKRGDAQRKLFTGLPLKSVATSTMTERDGSTSEETTVTEIVDLRRVELDASAFQIPAGYTKLDMKAFMNVGNQLRNALGGAGRKPGSSTSENSGGSLADDIAGAAKDVAKSAAEEAKQETKNAAKDEARGAADDAKAKAKCALGGLLGRKKC
jgi:hypothetical protein